MIEGRTEFRYRGHTFEELKKMDMNEFMALLQSRPRRSLKRGFTEQQKIFLANIKDARAQLDAGKEPKIVKTHCRDMVVIPTMVGLQVGIHNGREFVKVQIKPEMLGHVLGEFTYNRKRVEHHAPGVGATKGSAFIPTK